MRLMALRISWLISILIAGCMSPIPADVVDDTEDVVIDPVDESVAGNVVAFSMDAEQFATFAKWLGNRNTLSIENAVHVKQDNVTLDAQAGTRFSYEMADSSGTFTFEKPYPIVKAGFAKLIGGVSLHEVTINGDGSGLAATGLGKYRFRWMDDEDAGSAAAANELPQVWAYSQPGCPPCVRARLEIAAAKDLPFRVVWRDEAAPDWLQSRPAFWWHTTADQPSQKDVNNTRQTTGWNGIKDFTERWKNSRTPKRFQRTASSGISHHAGHDCPQCGREQYVIANDSGPNHTHRCDSCATTWYHADAGNARTFFGLKY